MFPSLKGRSSNLVSRLRLLTSAVMVSELIRLAQGHMFKLSCYVPNWGQDLGKAGVMAWTKISDLSFLKVMKVVVAHAAS